MSTAHLLQVHRVPTWTSGVYCSCYAWPRCVRQYGSGKSPCMFLVPLAVSDSGMGVVISPLNALMDQQVRIYRVLLVSVIVDAS